MRVDVVFGAQELTPSDVQGRVVAVIDVLRASTTIAVALANGARAVVPLESSEEVVTRAKTLERGDVPTRRRAEDARDSRVRLRQLAAGVHARGGRRQDDADDDDQRHGGASRGAGRA